MQYFGKFSFFCNVWRHGILYFAVKQMQASMAETSKVICTLKKYDLAMKIIVTITFLLYFTFLHSCFNPIAGDLYPIYENHDIGDVFAYRTKHKNAKPCLIDGKRIFLEREDQNKSFIRDFFIGGNRFYVYHLQYMDNDNERKNILTYKFEPSGGIGAVIQGTGFGINASNDSIEFIYNINPYDGITIDSSIFSDKITVQKSIPEHKASAAQCYMEWFN